MRTVGRCGHVADAGCALGGEVGHAGGCHSGVHPQALTVLGQVLLMALTITAATVCFIFVLAMTTSFDFTRLGAITDVRWVGSFLPGSYWAPLTVRPITVCIPA